MYSQAYPPGDGGVPGSGDSSIRENPPHPYADDIAYFNGKDFYMGELCTLMATALVPPGASRDFYGNGTHFWVDQDRLPGIAQCSAFESLCQPDVIQVASHIPLPPSIENGQWMGYGQAICRHTWDFPMTNEVEIYCLPHSFEPRGGYKVTVNPDTGRAVTVGFYQSNGLGELDTEVAAGCLSWSGWGCRGKCQIPLW